MNKIIKVYDFSHTKSGDADEKKKVENQYSNCLINTHFYDN